MRSEQRLTLGGCVGGSVLVTLVLALVCRNDSIENEFQSDAQVSQWTSAGRMRRVKDNEVHRDFREKAEIH